MLHGWITGRLALLFALFCLLCGQAQAQSTSTVDTAVCDMLRRFGVRVDSNALPALIAEALARTADPGARLVTATNLAPALELDVEQWPEGILYTRPNAVGAGLAARFVDAMVSSGRSNETGVVLDLRGIGGDGYADAAQLAGPLATTNACLFRLHDATGRVVQVFSAPVSNAVTYPPLMVVTDRETHGAAEALAAVVQRCHRALLIGEPTRGEPAARAVLTLATNLHVLVATRWVRLPDGSDYGGQGVIPDIAVERDEVTAVVPKDLQAWRRKPASARARRDLELVKRVAEDPPLRRAVDIMLGLRAVRLATVED